MSESLVAFTSMERTHEEVVRVWIWAANLEELHQIMELAVYVTTNSHWAFLGGRQSVSVSGSRCLRTTGCTLDSSCSISLACPRGK